MPHPSKVLLWLALLGLGVGSWFWLRAPRETAEWLKVETPRFATVGQTLTVRVTTTVSTPAMVTADLHWSTTRRENRGLLSRGPAKAAGNPGSILSFQLEVPPQEEMGYVRAVVYAGPVAGWAQHAEAATSDYIAVHPAGEKPRKEAAMESIAMFDQRPDPAAFRQDSTAVQVIIALLWTAAAAQWWRHRKDRAAAGRSGQVLTLACLLAVAWEVLPVEGVVGEKIRAMAINHRWYADRAGIQVVVTSVILAAAAGVVATTWSRHRDRARRCTWAGLAGYAGVSLASLCSLHKVDAILATMVLSVSTLQWVQVLAALVAVVGGAPARAPSPAPPPTGPTA